MNDDTELLRRYAETGDQAAFAEVVRRHIDLVHSAAARQVNGDAHLAEDVTQLVFTDLARKARMVAGERVLAGWLFVSARYAASKVVRSERRRRVREQEAHMMQEVSREGGADPDWPRVRPVLDEAMGELGEMDRAAILLRYFEGRGFAEVGERLKLNENTARMRVERALDKLHALLARRGVTSTTGALAAALANQAVLAAPAGLAGAVTGAVLASAGAGAVAGGAAAGGLLSVTKLQLGLTGALAVVGAGGLVVQHDELEALRRESAALRVEVSEAEHLRGENLRLARALAEVERGRAEAAELARLRGEVAGLRVQIGERADAREAAARARLAAVEAEARARAQALAGKAKAPGTVQGPDRLPQASVRVPPRYPQEMRQAGITGEVVVGFVVDANGDVQDATAVKSTRPEFEAAAVEAVAQWKFDPGIKGSRPVNTRMEQRISFSLGESEAPPGELRPVDNNTWF